METAIAQNSLESSRRSGRSDSSWTRRGVMRTYNAAAALQEQLFRVATTDCLLTGRSRSQAVTRRLNRPINADRKGAKNTRIAEKTNLGTTRDFTEHCFDRKVQRAFALSLRRCIFRLR